MVLAVSTRTSTYYETRSTELLLRTKMVTRHAPVILWLHSRLDAGEKASLVQYNVDFVYPVSNRQ